MIPSDTYKQHAAECVRLAQLTQDPDTKAILLKMAEAWLRMADAADAPKPGRPSE